MKILNNIFSSKNKYKNISKFLYILSLHLIFAFSLIFLIISLYNKSGIFAIADKVISLVLSFIGLCTCKNTKKYFARVSLVFYALFFVLPFTLIINNNPEYHTIIFILLFSYLILSLMDPKFSAIVCSVCLVEYLILIFINAKYPLLFSGIFAHRSDALLFQPIMLTCITLILVVLFYHYNRSILNVDRLNKQLKRDSKLNNMLLNLTYLASKDNDIESILDYILNEIIDIIDFAAKGSIIKNVDGICEFICVSGYDIDMLNKIKMPISKSHLYHLTNGKMDKTILIDEFDILKKSYNIDQFNSAGFHYSSTSLTSPIQLDDKIWGIVTIDSHENTTFNHSDFKLIEILSVEISKLISFSNLLTDNDNLKNRDSLTGLYNRRCFNNIFEEILSFDKVIDLTLIAIDLDNLKKINDSHGHVNGDKYILKLSNALKEFFDEDSVITRYGGDEFFVLLKNKSKIQSKAIISRIKSYLNKSPLIIKDKTINVDFSYGIVESDNSKKSEDLIAHADYEMYLNKHLKKTTAFVNKALKE